MGDTDGEVRCLGCGWSASVPLPIDVEDADDVGMALLRTHDSEQHGGLGHVLIDMTWGMHNSARMMLNVSGERAVQRWRWRSPIWFRRVRRRECEIGVRSPLVRRMVWKGRR